MPAKVDDRIVGLDPGLARCGYAVIDGDRRRPRLVAAGTLVTAAGQDGAQRLVALATSLQQLLVRYRPTRAAFERLFFQTNTSTAMAVSEARGVLRLVCARAKLPAREFTPTTVKRTVTGNGSADKRAMQKMVRLLLGASPAWRDDDAADAAAVALTAAFHPTGYGS